MKKKDEEKRQKVENVRKRKELKELNKTLIHKKVKRIKPNSSNRQNREAKENYDAEKERIKCSLCEDDLYSDTEEDSEKNIGCDYCPRWYHLRCTEFAACTYDEVATRDFTCDVCK
ncbi:hypothetical protein QE152_g4791 [Popillia japonica]|uniref:PHD-type domain-containing protein n=1 Tax=Popillia japonica TaxID=7064 RepID=A0AAW1N061_POPJA